MDAAAPRHTNRLATESSPYLLQHAHNPVDWRPWGDEAFEVAAREGKPVFLSIGYSTCHWCHVMERESFEDEDVAQLLNAEFVCIKVDREERPDVDALYMASVQALTGQGGWPLSVWLTPDRKPFFGGTYFPPTDRYGRPGFTTILTRIATLWRERRRDLEQQSEQVLGHIGERAGADADGTLDADTLDTAVRQYRAAFDAQYGGFGPPPKFPRAFSLSFLMRQAARGHAAELLPLVRGTLDALARGGIHDQVGGGFHRYSTDREWLVPHFEKMLYDQALLGRAYLDAFALTHDPRYAAVARDVCDYVLRDLRDEAGGFHCAEDADSEGEEGVFYVWTRAQVEAVLGAADAALFCDVHDVSAEGNFVEEASRRRTGASIPRLAEPLAAHAQRLGTTEDALEARLAPLRAQLLAARARRVRPHLDDKVLTDWNGLMIGTLARAGALLDEPRYTAAANEAADFVLTHLRTDGGLLHRYRKGEAGIPAFLDDHAYLAWGLLELHQATQEPARLVAAREIAHALVARFRDDATGTFRLVDAHADGIAPPTDLYDGALPSGNSLAVYALLRIGRLCGDEELAAAGRRALAGWAGTIERYPMGYAFALLALDDELGAAREVVVAGAADDPQTRALLAEAARGFRPRELVVLVPSGPAGDALRAAAPELATKVPVDGRAAAYVCTGRTCAAPVTSVEALRALLD